ncbi:hypothetical protein [Vibrio sp. LaRot3]|uniref:hypothetical protein n=1 Tax=Vibrio sp. LaRot3 TaxID=2998829 RepID=UPI0022CDED11|nr:hypothetical protein [Vibrio sp. LaRot3]MDA0147457.1 hypothetical protein [Vibrio sp. LaRot3]
MRAHSLRTICLILLSSLTFILSSVASSAPLMPIQMMQMNTASSASCHSMTHNGADTSTPANSDNVTPIQSTMHHSSPGNSQQFADIDCETNTNLDHNCCDTTCITVVAALLHPPVLPAQHSSMVELTPEQARSTVRVSRSLYRPPTL